MERKSEKNNDFELKNVDKGLDKGYNSNSKEKVNKILVVVANGVLGEIRD